MKKFKLEIITPEKTVFSKEIDQVTLPTFQGEITVLANHIPLISSLVGGELKIVADNEQTFMAVSGGLIQVDPTGVRILADTAERPEEIDIERAQEARQRAQKLLEEAKDKEAVDYTALAAKIEKELARLKVASRHRHQKQPTIKSE